VRFEATPAQQAKLDKLCLYIEGFADGAELSWLQVEHDTKVAMDLKGRDMFRRCLLKVRGRGGYESVRGEGIKLSSPGTALSIVNDHGRRVGRAIGNWTKTVEETKVRHFDEMPSDHQQQLLARSSFAGALRTMAAGFRHGKVLKEK
jgi:hypothetical protein